MKLSDLHFNSLNDVHQQLAEISDVLRFIRVHYQGELPIPDALVGSCLDDLGDCLAEIKQTAAGSLT